MTLTETQKFEIISKHSNGNLSNQKIANDMGINRHTVSLWISRYNTNKNLERKPGSGLHKKTINK